MMFFFTSQKVIASIADQLDQICMDSLHAREKTGQGLDVLLTHPDFISHAPPDPDEPNGAHVIRLGNQLREFFFFIRKQEAIIEVAGIENFDGAIVTAIYPDKYLVRLDATRLIGKHTKQLLREFLNRYRAIDGSVRIWRP
jgi:hypothetical protein